MHNNLPGFSLSVYTLCSVHQGEDSTGITHNTLKSKSCVTLENLADNFFLNHVIVERKYETSLLILPVTLITQITE